MSKAGTPDLRLGLIGDNIARSRSPLLHRLAGAQNGMVVPRARELLNQVLATDPGDPMARFFLALAKAQDGDVDGEAKYQHRQPGPGVRPIEAARRQE